MSALAYVPVPDGFGGVRHELRAVNDAAPARKTRKKRVVPDPIKANPDASAQTLRQFIERIERVNAEIADLQDDKREILNEAKSQGYDKATMLVIVGIRAKEKHVLDEAEAILEAYKTALGLG